MNESQDTKKQTPILLINNIIMTIYPTVSCRSWRAADCSQNNRVPVDRYVTPIYVAVDLTKSDPVFFPSKDRKGLVL